MRTPRSVASLAAILAAIGVLTCAPAANAALSWAPPTLTSPVTVQLTTGNDTLKLSDTTDYIVRYPATKKVGYTKLIGGRNIVIIGGAGTIPPFTSTSDRRNIFIQDGPGAVNRTVHIEGVQIDASGGGEGDGIAISAPKALVQIENVRITGLLGQYDRPSGSVHEHADIVQPWGGVRELRIDRLTGSSTYQGLQINRDLGTVGAATVRNVNITALAPMIAGATAGGYMLWLNCPSYPISFSNVYITPRSGRALTKSVWPDSSASSCAAQSSTVEGAQGVTWGAGQSQVTGGIKAGPTTGDFVPAGVAGTAYVSPGYGAAATRPPLAAGVTGWVWVHTAFGGSAPAWKWTATGWVYAPVATGTQVYTSPFPGSTDWRWIWTNGAWHAAHAADLSLTP